MSDCTIIILAAGSSSRMGSPKQLLPYKHTTLLGWAIEQALASEAQAVICVLGSNNELVKKSISHYPVKTIYNKRYKQGLSTSIVSAIKTKPETEAILVMSADQPLIKASLLNELLRLHDKFPDKIIASNYGNSNGVPAVFPSQYFDHLLKLKGDKGAREFLNQTESDVLSISGIEFLKDIDTPNDYRNLVDSQKNK